MDELHQGLPEAVVCALQWISVLLQVRSDSSRGALNVHVLAHDCVASANAWNVRAELHVYGCVYMCVPVCACVCIQTAVLRVCIAWYCMYTMCTDCWGVCCDRWVVFQTSPNYVESVHTDSIKDEGTCNSDRVSSFIRDYQRGASAVGYQCHVTFFPSQNSGRDGSYLSGNH